MLKHHMYTFCINDHGLRLNVKKVKGMILSRIA